MIYSYARRMAGKVFRAMSLMLAMVVRQFPDKTVLAIRENTGLLKKLDYQRHDIYLHVDSRIENDIRLFSCSKEPETIEWIEDFFTPGDVFLDIGANIGAYSLVAAKFCSGEIKVYSLEPSFVNFPNLCQNIHSNRCQEIIIPLQIALSNATEIITFNYQNLTSGGAMHAAGLALDYKGNAFDPVAQQPVLSYRLDDLLPQFSIPVPNHLKIDVDGIELDVLKGAELTLKNSAVKSILIEIEEDHNQSAQIKQYITGCGLEFHSKHKYVHGGETGPLSRIYNYIYQRTTTAKGLQSRTAPRSTIRTEEAWNLENTEIGTK